jgi:SagB-type dehydrogenase family enzyme
VFCVENLSPGFYRYLPAEHQLLFEFQEDGAVAKLGAAVQGQTFVCRSSVTFIWTAIPYRMEWRYGRAAHKFIAMEAGHVCQNLYLACEAIGAGTCAIGVYQQGLLDSLLRIDGEDEFTVYLAPVGKVAAPGRPRAV